METGDDKDETLPLERLRLEAVTEFDSMPWAGAAQTSDRGRRDLKPRLEK